MTPAATNYIEERSVGTISRNIRRQFTDDQLHDLRERLAEVEIKRSDEEDILADISRERKASIKELKSQSRKLLKDIRNRYIDEEIGATPSRTSMLV